MKRTLFAEIIAWMKEDLFVKSRLDLAECVCGAVSSVRGLNELLLCMLVNMWLLCIQLLSFEHANEVCNVGPELELS